MKKTALLLVIFFSTNGISKSQYPTYVNAGIASPKLSFTADNSGGMIEPPDLLEVDYEPEVPLVGFLGVSAYGFSLSISNQLEESDSKMTFTDYSISYGLSWLGFDASYSEFSNFKIKTGRGFDVEIDKSLKQKNDLDVALITASFYIFPLRFGYDHGAAFEPAAKKESGIGLGVLANGNRLSIDTDDGFIPEAWQAAFGNDGDFYRGVVNGLGFSLALAGVIKMGSFYVAAVGSHGRGKQKYAYEAGPEKFKGEGGTDHSFLRTNIGWLGQSFFWVIDGRIESPSYVFQHMTLSASRVEVLGSIGHILK